jgi:heme/copper-type cytochrome/quinol oxidase subunit 3
MKTFDTVLYIVTTLSWFLLSVLFGTLTMEAWKRTRDDIYSLDLAVGLAFLNLPLVVAYMATVWFAYSALKRRPYGGTLKAFAKSFALGYGFLILVAISFNLARKLAA